MTKQIKNVAKPLDCITFQEVFIMQFSKEVKNTLWNLIDEMTLDLSRFTIHPRKDFTRKKKWDFPTLMKFIISMEGQSLKNELHKYFGYTADCPTNASFNQRRAQLHPAAFEFLFKNFTAEYSRKPETFNGYRLIACDGSDINISYDPNDEDTYFTNQNARGFNQLHLNAMYDLTNKLYTDIIIQPGRLENENKAFCDMVDRYTGIKKSIFIADRGYESYNNLAHVIENGRYFLFRCKDIDSNGILYGLKHKLPEKDIFDFTLSIILTRKCTKEVLEHPEKYKCFHKKDCLDYIDLEKNPYYEIQLRILRFPISDTTYECIITNLPNAKFAMEDIKKIYGMRWGIETSFRELKYAVGLTSFHAKKREYILQEIWARLILYNFCEVITAHTVIKKSTKKYVYQVNYTFAIHICRYFISKMAENSPPDVEALISKEILPVRPGRHDPRKVDHKKVVSFLYRVA